MTVITACTNRRAHRHTLPELRPLDAYADMIPRNLIDKYVELHEQPNARKQHRAATMSTVVLRDLWSFLHTYRAMPLPKFVASVEPISETYNARLAAADLMFLADEHMAAHQLGVTVDALRNQHWHTTNSPMDHAEKRGMLALLRAGLLNGFQLEHALRLCGSGGWEDLATFREPDSSQSAGRSRNRTAAYGYRWFPRRGVEGEDRTIGRPRDAAPASSVATR
ncbi:hypothetical protein [Curtobacterium sp. PhB136]|uniref:hypothetical protein n=1 Tax=Curtobacterium sp. PhB136 TaxID=2485181 RepID=UPI00104C8F99|nr:hypothetical protein [Curtobacterium sp. PhB136]TCK59265.1 hypothetical protein EDF27_3787 [Curtobacterium sp. PhB136]